MEISLTRIEYRKNSYLLGFSLVPLIAASLLPMKASSASPVRRTLLGGHFAPSSEMRRTLSRRPSCHAKSTAAAGTRAAKETHNVTMASRHTNAQGCCAIMYCLIFGCTSLHQKTHNGKCRDGHWRCCTIVCCSIFGCTTFHQKARSIKMAIGSCNVQGRCTSVCCLINDWSRLD